MFSSSSLPKRKSAGGKSRANNKHVWYNPETRQRFSDRPPDVNQCLHFDSELEFSVWLGFSSQQKTDIWIHPVIELLPRPNLITWRPDFYFSLEKLIVEVKGDWILSKASSGSKALLITQIKLAQHKGLRVVLMGDSEFQIGEFTVHDYHKGAIDYALSD